MAIVAPPLRVPHTVLLVAVGLVIGALAAPLGLQGRLQVTPDLVLLVLLPGLVFEAAYRLRLSELRRWSSALLLLAVPGVLISAAVVAIVLHVATGLRADLAFLVGAMISATDPAAVVATFKRLQVPRSIATLVDGESLLNDGTGLILFAIAVRAVSEPVGPVDAVAVLRLGGRRSARPSGWRPVSLLPGSSPASATISSSSRSRSSSPTGPISSPMSCTPRA